MTIRSSVLAGLAAVAATFVLAACSTAEPPAQVAALPPPPPPPPAITLSASLFEEASAWRGYMTRAAATPTVFPDAPTVASSLRAGASYEPKQLLRGSIAYAAVIALQDQAYIANIRTYAVDPAQRQRIAAQILANPYSVTNYPGADRAAGLIISALGNDGTKVLLAGRAVKQSAYDVQRQKWSKEFVPNREGRLADVRTLSSTPIRGDIEEVGRMQSASLNGGSAAGPDGIVGQAASAPYSPVVVRGLALAALAALGEAGDDKLIALEPMFTDEPSMFCLNMSKLMLYQCLAAAKPHYEDVFCLGQHVLIDTGQCTLKSAGAPMPIEPPKPVVVATKAPTPKAPAKPAAKPKAKGG
ncbi:hypothetical protein [Caulobacter sp. NIBR1757]|uniref:hypothetical protein n=1 Tax=Caulobacter sp. NIBR1757 TaxID=3016000 RepID=UPI0022F0FBF3|nr:hypothetical protein [Caulobacter sp. NIBR1757]WGM38285.1 hypothetical protein AMEJIAPC_01187 [Caulobacter sp. NIBR1757]